MPQPQCQGRLLAHELPVLLGLGPGARQEVAFLNQLRQLLAGVLQQRLPAAPGLKLLLEGPLANIADLVDAGLVLGVGGLCKQHRLLPLPQAAQVDPLPAAFAFTRGYQVPRIHQAVSAGLVCLWLISRCHCPQLADIVFLLFLVRGLEKLHINLVLSIEVRGGRSISPSILFGLQDGANGNGVLLIHEAHQTNKDFLDRPTRIPRLFVEIAHGQANALVDLKAPAGRQHLD
mmetsp:Transcript_132793/g.314728  ORF Transcript_132793/g.314728 Transcript_132793/m.314728 type:complete len:232 (+) Transcript_132793:345-1040(+)